MKRPEVMTQRELVAGIREALRAGVRALELGEEEIFEEVRAELMPLAGEYQRRLQIERDQYSPRSSIVVTMG